MESPVSELADPPQNDAAAALAWARALRQGGAWREGLVEFLVMLQVDPAQRVALLDGLPAALT